MGHLPCFFINLNKIIIIYIMFANDKKVILEVSIFSKNLSSNMGVILKLYLQVLKGTFRRT